VIVAQMIFFFFNNESYKNQRDHMKWGL